LAGGPGIATPPGRLANAINDAERRYLAGYYLALILAPALIAGPDASHLALVFPESNLAVFAGRRFLLLVRRVSAHDLSHHVAGNGKNGG